MEGEDDRPVLGEKLVEIRVTQAVRELTSGLQFQKVKDVDHQDLQVRQALTQDGDGGERLQSRHVATTGHDHAGHNAVVVAGS
jgi:hypothetical protein